MAAMEARRGRIGAVRARLVLPLAIALAATTLLVGGAPTAASARPAPRLAHPTATARALVDRFLTLIVHKDHAGLQRLLSPAFQVQRGDGSGAAKREYLANLATINHFEVSKLTATHAGGSLIVRYLATVEGITNGKPYTPGPAPRLSVFSWNGKRWQLVAHANFNPLTG